MASYEIVLSFITRENYPTVSTRVRILKVENEHEAIEYAKILLYQKVKDTCGCIPNGILEIDGCYELDTNGRPIWRGGK